MFFVASALLLIFLVALVAEPERWPARLVAFLQENRVHHG